MADHGGRSAGEQRGRLLRERAKRGVAHGVDTSVKTVKAPSRNPSGDRSSAEPDRLELSARHDAVLSGCQSCDRGISRSGHFDFSERSNDPRQRRSAGVTAAVHFDRRSRRRGERWPQYIVTVIFPRGGARAGRRREFWTVGVRFGRLPLGDQTRRGFCMVVGRGHAARMPAGAGERERL
jgi:hypothetical protein